VKGVNMFRVLWTCVALLTSSALHAQPRDANVGVSEDWAEMYRDSKLSDDEKRGANPCIRPDRMALEMHPRRRGARIAICVGRVKSRFVSAAWENGLDERGAPLKPDAGARKLAEMELWLRSLVGKYRIEGEYAVLDGGSQISGTAECFGIGGGAGVSCTISAKWPVAREQRKDKNLDESLGYAMQTMVLLFGIDKVAPRIRVTLMDFRAIRMDGFLVDDAVIFDVKSSPELPLLTILGGGVIGARPIVAYTWYSTRVALKTTGDVAVQFIVMPADIRATRPKEFDLKLRREPAVRGATMGAQTLTR
jgi:hypothetical protein